MQSFRKFKGRLRDELHRPYEAVSVLCIYWEDADNPGFREEARKIQDLFSRVFHFSIDEYAIPSQGDFQLLLHDRINEFAREKLGSGPTLKILHYGGHGDPNNADKEGRRLKWAQQSFGGPEANWYELEPLLRYAVSDVLLIFDCCYSGQAGRGPPEDWPNPAAILAACPVGGQTTPPGEESFTTLLVRETEEILDQYGLVPIEVLYANLRNKTVRQSPVYGLIGTSRVKEPDSRASRICFQPLNDNTEQPALHLQETRSIITLSIGLRIPYGDDGNVLDKIADCILNRTPRAVTSIEPIGWSPQVRQPRNRAVPQSSSSVGIRTENRASTSEYGTPDTTTTGSSPEPTTHSPNEPNGTFIERYEHDSDFDPAPFEPPNRKLLGFLNEEESGSLKCKRWFQVRPSGYDPEFEIPMRPSGYVLEFEIPPGCHGEPQSLEAVITSNDHPPTPGRRLIIARNLLERVRFWHDSGWAHQNIASHTIVFLRYHNGNIDYDRPYLTKFGYCQQLTEEKEHRWSARSPEREHHVLPFVGDSCRAKDVVALGLVLFAVGLWIPEEEVFPKQESSLAVFRKQVEENGKRLGTMMGPQYQHAAEACLNSFDPFSAKQAIDVEAQNALGDATTILPRTSHSMPDYF